MIIEGMKNKLILSLLLTVSCSQAMADWVRISTTESSVFYIDSEMTRKVDAHVMIWLLRDHTSAQFAGSVKVLSSKDLIEVDCKGRRIRRSYSSDHPQHMGEGELVSSEHGPMSWNYATPNTIARQIVNLACAQS